MKPSSVQAAKPRKMSATVKLLATVWFYDDGTTDLKSQVHDEIMDGDFHDVETLDISDIEEIKE